jgi:hypothetical protein
MRSDIMERAVKRRQFTLRDLFWLTIVTAISLGWWLDHRRGTDALDELRLQWLYSIPPPYPREEVLQSLQAENAALRESLEQLRPAGGDEPTP